MVGRTRLSRSVAGRALRWSKASPPLGNPADETGRRIGCGCRSASITALLSWLPQRHPVRTGAAFFASLGTSSRGLSPLPLFFLSPLSDGTEKRERRLSHDYSLFLSRSERRLPGRWLSISAPVSDARSSSSELKKCQLSDHASAAALMTKLACLVGRSMATQRPRQACQLRRLIAVIETDSTARAARSALQHRVGVSTTPESPSTTRYGHMVGSRALVSPGKKNPEAPSARH